MDAEQACRIMCKCMGGNCEGNTQETVCYVSLVVTPAKSDEEVERTGAWLGREQIVGSTPMPMMIVAIDERVDTRGEME